LLETLSFQELLALFLLVTDAEAASSQAGGSMPRNARSSRRVLEKKVTSFNLYLDQAHQIQAIMESTGATKDAPVMRELLDEALAARRRKAAGLAPEASPAVQGLAESLQNIQTLLLKLIAQGQTSLKVQGLSLELLQETLAEAGVGRAVLWNDIVVPLLIGRGMTTDDIARHLADQTGKAKNHAYTLAEEIRNSQLTADE
jgi:hypothetical protein